jgi:hypothetical protein
MLSQLFLAAFEKSGGIPPPLPAAARAATNPMANALFSGMKSAPKTNVMSSLVSGAAKSPMMSKLVKGAHLQGTVLDAFVDELGKIASDLTEAARAQIAKKNFALSKNQSSTGKPAYPIHDREHARAALGMVGMHGTSAQKAEVRKDVARQYPDMLKKKAASLASRVGAGLRSERGGHGAELAGLGMLAALPADHMQAKLRAGRGGDWQRKSLLGGEAGHAIGDIAGLGTLAAPSALHLLGKH